MQELFSCRSSRTVLKEFHVPPVGKWSIRSRYLPTSGFCNVYTHIARNMQHISQRVIEIFCDIRSGGLSISRGFRLAFGFIRIAQNPRFHCLAGDFEFLRDKVCRHRDSTILGSDCSLAFV
jgi:hypothetical protein